jgi:[ribosomal protein S18]-alanine N-acetyltransferase
VSMQSAPQLRDMSWDDLDAVLAIEQQVHKHPWTRGMFNDALAHGYLCKIYAQDNEIVGYAVLMPALDEVHLLDISIARAHQRKGFGENILNTIKYLSFEHGFLRIILEVRRSNLAAYALYRKVGYRDIGVRRDYYPADNGREDALVMECKLK